MNIIEINNDYDFNNLDFESPSSLNGGNYFTKLINKNNFKSVYLQLPKCGTKQGLVKTNNKTYIDLMFSQEDEYVLEWIEKLENNLKELIFEK